MSSAWKIGVGTGSVILGVYLMFKFNDLGSVIIGVVAIAFGISLLAGK